MDELKLPPGISARLEEYVGLLRRAYGDGLISVILYGSASSGEFAEKRSNINIVVVLSDTSLENLSRCRSLANSPKFRMMNPVFFTEEYIASSLDTFPIEFLDIMENHKVLYGRDVVKGLKIDARNLRFQCEQELKSKLINIKKRYLAANSRRDIEGLLFATFTSAIHIMRNLLRLKGIRPPYIKEDVLAESERALGVNTTVLSKILWAKKKSMALSHKDLDALMTGFVKELEAIVRAVDTMQ